MEGPHSVEVRAKLESTESAAMMQDPRHSGSLRHLAGTPVTLEKLHQGKLYRVYGHPEGNADQDKKRQITEMSKSVPGLHPIRFSIAIPSATLNEHERKASQKE
jgi:hypothetical protein